MTLSARDLLDAFSGPAATPGGGSASALAGALGASLLMMVAAMPKTKSGDPAERAALDAAGAALETRRTRLIELVDEDSAAYDRVMAAFKLPKATEEEKVARRVAIQQATKSATDTPLAVMMAAADALGFARTVAQHGNRNASSDVKVGISLLLSACEGAAENVAINIPGLPDDMRLQVEADAQSARANAEQAAQEARGGLR